MASSASRLTPTSACRGMERQATQALVDAAHQVCPHSKVGEVLSIPAGAIHAVKNVGSGNAAEHARYVVEKGKPLVVLVK